MKNKKKKGFTLIELLAIIVILAIIAVITVPIILNVIENSKKGAAKDSAYGYKDAINKYYVSELYENLDFKLDGTYTITDKGRLSNGTGVYEIPFTGTQPTGGYLTYENNILKTGCITMDEYAITIENGEVTTVEKGECEVLNEKFVTIVEQAEEGKIQTGDELAIGSEHFYVVSSNENETVLLAKYNLLVGNIYDSSGNKMGEISEDEDGYGIQNETAICYTKDSNEYIGTVAFSLTNYWDGNVGEGLMYPGQYSDPNYPNIYDVRYSGVSNDDYSVAYYVENYKDELEKMGATNIKARLLTYQEIKNLGCDTSSGTCTTVSEKNKFVYLTSYWLSSGVSNRVWSVYSFGKILDDYFNLGSRYGVRPVIVVNTSDIQL